MGNEDLEAGRPDSDSWRLPWLRLHLAARELLKTSPAAPDWPEVKRELAHCADLRRAIVRAEWFN